MSGPDESIRDDAEPTGDAEEACAQAPVDPDHGDGAETRRFVVRRAVGKRLDVYVQGRLRGISRSRVQKLIDRGGVTVNDQQPKASHTVHRGDRIEVILPPPAFRTIEPDPIELDVLYEDDWFIIINKQANLIVHPARSHLRGTLVNGLAWYFKQQCERSGHSWEQWKTRGFRRQKPSGGVEGLSDVGADGLRPGIVHRLDKNTTGVMVVAKHDDAHWQIARQFEDRSTLKAYLALVHGGPDDAAGAIDHPIGKHPSYREPYAVRHDSSGKQSVTLYRVRERYAGFTLVELELKTGRTHQIRVHLSYMGWPIVGDVMYGGEPIGPDDLSSPPVPAGGRALLNFARDKKEGDRIEARAAVRDDLIIAHPALHATLLRFRHPIADELVTFTAPLHEPMRGLVAELRQRPVDGPVANRGCLVDLEQAVPT